MAKEEEEEEDEVEEVEDSDKEDEEYVASFLATIEKMYVRQTQHSNALAKILKRQEFMMTKIYGRLFLDEVTSSGGGGEGGSAH